MKITIENFITDELTNKVYISNLLEKCSGFEQTTARNLKSGIESFCPNLGLLVNTKDVWARDYMPIQLTKEIYLSYIYKPDYLAEKPKFITNWQEHNVHTKKRFSFQVVQMPIILDGGNVVKAIVDNQPCMIMCKKVLRENNISSETAFQKWWDNWWKENFSGTAMKLVLLPWEGEEVNPIGHADGMVRFIGNGKVLMTNYLDFDKKKKNKNKKNKEAFGEIMKKALTDADFEVITLEFWDKFKNDAHYQHLFNESWCYINYLQVGNRILLPSLGYATLDQEAARQIGNAFNTKNQIEIINVDMTSIVNDPKDNENSGGALNCLTWTTME